MQQKKTFGTSFRSSLSWNILNIGVGQVMTLGIFLLLTTRLSPTVFGVFALALVFIEFFNLEGRFSVIDSMVQKQRFDKKALSTVYWLATGLYSAFALLFVFLAPTIAAAFGNDQVTDVLRALALTLILIPLMFGPMAVLSAQQDFKAMTLRVIFAKFSGGIAALVIAFGPHPEWALVAQRLVATTAQSTLLIIQTRIIPTFDFDLPWAKEFAAEAGRIFLAQTGVQSLLRLLDIAIATFFGAAAVGLWRIAERIIQATNGAFAAPISMLWVILLSAKDTDPEEKQRIFLNLMHLGATMLVPVFVGISLISQDFINVFVDSEFRPVGPILGLLAAFGSLAPFYFFRNSALIALKRSQTLVLLAVIDLVLLTVLCLIMNRFGLLGMVCGLGLVYLKAAIWFMPIVLKEVNVSFVALFARISPAYLGALFMVAAVSATSGFYADAPSIAKIGLKASTGVIAYVGYFFLVHRNWLRQTIELVRERDAQVRPA